jgi:phytol kinase
MEYKTTETTIQLSDYTRRAQAAVVSEELRRELVRKSLHVLIAFVPSIATIAGVAPTLALLTAGVLFYSGAEYLRQQGGSIALVSALTVIASRPRDKGHFVLGPVTLGVGAMLALLLYPAPAAFIAIYALAFGDGIASLAGKVFGTVRIVGSKSLEGSLACFIAVFAATAAVTHDLPASVMIAGTATTLELLPTNDMDNVILPIGTGLMATILIV